MFWTTRSLSKLPVTTGLNIYFDFAVKVLSFSLLELHSRSKRYEKAGCISNLRLRCILRPYCSMCWDLGQSILQVSNIFNNLCFSTAAYYSNIWFGLLWISLFFLYCIFSNFFCTFASCFFILFYNSFAVLLHVFFFIWIAFGFLNHFCNFLTTIVFFALMKSTNSLHGSNLLSIFVE